MGVQNNKAIVEQYFNAQRSGNLFEGLSLLADDVMWTIPGNWEMAGVFTKPQMAKMMEGLNMFEGGLNFEHQSIIAEDDKVAVLTVVSGRLTDGRIYRNTIFFLFTIANRKIKTVTESVDSHYSRIFWLKQE